MNSKNSILAFKFKRCRKQARRQEHSPPENESKTYILLHIFFIRLGYLGTFVWAPIPF